MQWGHLSYNSSAGYGEVAFQTQFVGAYRIVASPIYASGYTNFDYSVFPSVVSSTQATIYIRTHDGSAAYSGKALVYWIAFGRWKA